MAQEKKAAAGSSGGFIPVLPVPATPNSAVSDPAVAEPPRAPPMLEIPAPGGETLPPPVPKSSSTKPAAAKPIPDGPFPGPASVEEAQTASPRRAARRRPAGPVRSQIAANDDAPSIGGLIYALDQKPSNAPFHYAAIASGVWTAISIAFSWAIFASQYGEGAGLADILSRPSTLTTLAAIVVPVAVLWFLALIAWRSEELRLRSSTMTEVAIRLAEPDRMAEQSIASLGQAVRRQVSFMNDAVSRALGRAGELEALVHNEVSALERSYEENERKIRGLIQELSGERHALLNTSERVTNSLKTLGTDIPGLIEKLSNQQIKLAHIIQSAGENLSSLESAVGQSTNRLETTLGDRTSELQNVLEGYTNGLAIALGARTEQIQTVLAESVSSLNSTLLGRTETLQTVFEEYARALDTSLTNRAQSIDTQLVERTRALDQAFGQRLKAFDEAILNSTHSIDSAIGERALALTSALDNHAKTFGETISRQTQELDEQLISGISAVRRTSENITRQSLKAIEGLAGQSEMLKSVSENLLGQINSVTGRFDAQGQTIMRAANALETANYKIDTTLQNRHAELSHTLDRLSGKADEFGRVIEGYSSTIEGSLGEAEVRARTAAEQLRLGAENTKRLAMADIERLKSEAGAEGDKALEELRRRFANVSSTVTQQIDSLSARIDETTGEARQRAAKAATELAAEQSRIRDQMERFPAATRETADAMRQALADQLKAIDQLSALSSRVSQSRDVTLPSKPTSLTATFNRNTGTSFGGPVTGAGSDPARRGTPPAASLPPPQLNPAAVPRAGAPEPRDAWSLGDLLARASRDEEHQHSHGPQDAAAPFSLNVDVIAKALDPATASGLWTRLKSGQRGFMVRSIYSVEGRIVFDEVSRRLKTDPELQGTIDRYLEDFDRIHREADQRDSSGRLANAHLVSDTGRVYLFLAHAAGRLQ